MAKNTRSVPQKEQNILFAKSGNRCAFPKCDLPVIAEVEHQNKPLAEMAHMIAYSDDGPRSDPELAHEDRNKALNLILLCPTHHALVDKFQHHFHVHVLREMKIQHESKFAAPEFKKNPPLVEEPLHSSMLPISHLPFVVFSANTQYNKSNIQDLFDALNSTTDKNILYTFELRDKKLYAFDNLATPNNPFRGNYDQTTVRILKSTDLWASPDDRRLYVGLLNRALRGFLFQRRLKFDARHNRYYFLPEPNDIKRTFKYISLAGKRTTKTVVNNPVTRVTGEPKPYWVHLAANLSFQQIGCRQWVLTIRPEKHLTTDGFEPYSHASIGKKITRLKSTMYNWQYLQELQLWREFITDANKRKLLKFGKQAIVIENNLLKANIVWRGIPEDRKNFIAQEHDENLFTSYDIDALDDEEEELYDELSLDEYEE